MRLYRRLLAAVNVKGAFCRLNQGGNLVSTGRTAISFRDMRVRGRLAADVVTAGREPAGPEGTRKVLANH